ncbi:aspartate/glutamate/uridylate kinase [mine drainage metagenome]|uniref:Aspartate/glutamate/uridylate kinase n=1 Tax=mine drainage metagenome TaxID=410659 RepID=T0YMH6_9ZZZZ
MNNELYLLKIGGSLISSQTNPDEINFKAIMRILKEIENARKDKGFRLIIGHGSGTTGHVPSKKYNVGKGFTGEKSMIGSILTERACSTLNDIVVHTALDMGMPAFSFSPHSFSITSRGSISDVYTQPLHIALKRGFIPIVYGMC